MSGALGRVEIGFVLTASTSFAGVARGFRQSNPDIHLELHEMTSAEQIAALLDHQIDVAFLRPPLAGLRVLRWNVYSERFGDLPDDHRWRRQNGSISKCLISPIRHGADELVHDLQTRLVRACQRAGLNRDYQ